MITTTVSMEQTSGAHAVASRILTIDTIQADLDARRLWIDGVRVPLSCRQFDLLAALMDNAGRVMSPHDLRAICGAPCGPGEEVLLRAQIKALRRSLAAHPRALARLRTVRGFGYVFELRP